MEGPTRRRRTGRKTRWALLTTLTMLTIAGCGGSGGDSGSDARAVKSPGSRAASDTGSPSAAASSPSPSVTAADGTDTGACADGTCEIAVSEPVTIRFEAPKGPAKLSVTKVDKNEVGYKVTSGSGTNSGEASGAGSGCTSVLHGGGSSGSCGPAGEPPRKENGAVVLQLVAGADGTAILRLVSG